MPPVKIRNRSGRLHRDCLRVSLDYFLRKLDRGFGAAYIFEVVVGADGDSVLAGKQTENTKFVVLFEAVTDPIHRLDNDPVAPIDAVLGSFDVARQVMGGKVRFDAA